MKSQNDFFIFRSHSYRCISREAKKNNTVVMLPLLLQIKTTNSNKSKPSNKSNHINSHQQSNRIPINTATPRLYSKLKKQRTLCIQSEEEKSQKIQIKITEYPKKKHKNEALRKKNLQREKKWNLLRNTKRRDSDVR